MDNREYKVPRMIIITVLSHSILCLSNPPIGGGEGSGEQPELP